MHNPKSRLKYVLKSFSEAEFLVRHGTSSFPARHEVHGKTIRNLVLSWERARTQPEAVFLVRLGMSSFLARFKVLCSFPI